MKIIHLLRNYSALAIVVSSAVLVVSTNLSARGESKLLLGQWISAQEDPEASKHTIESQYSRKSNLALVPLSTTTNAIDPEAKDEEPTEFLTQAQGQVVVAPSSPVLRDPEEDGGVTVYTVKSGDNIGIIAKNHGITVNTILWANDLENADSIMPGDKIFILPIAGLTHIVKSGETLDKIAETYKADKEKIIAFNELPANGEIKEKQEIVIPGGEKEVPQSAAASSGLARREYATPSGGAPAVSGWKKLEGKAGTGHKFPYGYCTWYVAQRRFVPWSGNAGTWLYKAKSMGYKTGKEPRKGSILVTSESWWGHVAVVEKVGNGTITVSEMNYKGWAKTSTRTISTSNRVIKGYIY
ncbi:MAG: LysM peptidoglycan-binding domain-containing protein [Candidatus Moranbacteria bacterium]|nr:LysM peptidoglycan-binding domain-containing protein [Candidatus Moranbacteria bacterium]